MDKTSNVKNPLDLGSHQQANAYLTNHPHYLEIYRTVLDNIVLL